jgi:hypothetical protein
MASRRYSKRDQQRIIQDKMAELRERKIADAQTIYPMHPGGSVGALNEMLKDPSFTRDQSQAWIGQGQETMKERERDSKEFRERREEERQKGSYE